MTLRRLTVPACCLALAVSLAGCQEQRTVVVEQAQAGSVAGSGVPAAPPPPVRKPGGAMQCEAPWGTGPFTPMGRPVSTVSVPKPARALAEHVSGCGGVRFRIGSDGLPQDVEILAEYPAGYGYGEMVRQMIVSSRWAPRDDLSWHYLNATIRLPRG
jgi:hypothetical protein